MNTLEMAKWINRAVKVKIQDFIIEVVVLDVRNKYGKIRFLVRPVHGSGEGWIEANRIVSPN